MRAMLDHLPVIHQALPPTLAPESGLLVSPEWRRWIELVERVRPDDTRLEQRTHLENTRPLVGPDARRQAVHRVICLLHRFLERAKCQNAQHRTEDFFARDAMALRHTGEHRRLEV